MNVMRNFHLLSTRSHLNPPQLSLWLKKMLTRRASVRSRGQVNPTSLDLQRAPPSPIVLGHWTSHCACSLNFPPQTGLGVTCTSEWSKLAFGKTCTKIFVRLPRVVGEQSNTYRILLWYDRKSQHQRIKKQRRDELLVVTSRKFTLSTSRANCWACLGVFGAECPL